MARGTCRECTADIEVAIWDDPALSGAVVMVCAECQETVPEACLWDVSALEEAHAGWPGEDGNPNLLREHPLEDGESWTLRNRYADKETYLEHLRASWDGEVPEDFGAEIEVPDEDCWELFVRTVEDETAIEAGREALRAKSS